MFIVVGENEYKAGPAVGTGDTMHDALLSWACCGAALSVTILDAIQQYQEYNPTVYEGYILDIEPRVKIEWVDNPRT